VITATPFSENEMGYAAFEKLMVTLKIVQAVPTDENIRHELYRRFG
jgi:hypothetical protein